MKQESFLSLIYQQRCSLMLVLSLLIVWPSTAWCHGHPEQRTPAPRATLEQAPKEVKILFTEALEPAFSSLKVTDQQGHTVNQSDSRIGAGNTRLLVAPLKSLEPGTYTVHWHVVSVDGHTTQGQYKFQIKP